MDYRKVAALLPALIIAGCASHEGRYSPGCIAYAGDTVVLEGNRFEWDRFTDQVRVDGDGNIVDAFPGYPKRGTYRVDGQAVSMVAESGEAMGTMYLHRHDDDILLLTAEEHASWQRNEQYDDCVLTRESAERR